MSSPANKATSGIHKCWGGPREYREAPLTPLSRVLLGAGRKDEQRSARRRALCVREQADGGEGGLEQRDRGWLWQEMVLCLYHLAGYFFFSVRLYTGGGQS